MSNDIVKPGGLQPFDPITDDAIAFDRKGMPIFGNTFQPKLKPVLNEMVDVTISYPSGININSKHFPGYHDHVWKKCIVITIRKTFMKGHPRAGELTGFPEKIKDAIANPGFTNDTHPFLDLKLHTIRAGNYWKGVVEKVNAGTHYLSVRTWDGRPYVDKGQTEVARFEKLGYQEFEFKYLSGQGCVTPLINGRIVDPDNFIDLAGNDGLSKDDMLAWFNYPKPFKGGIIHFTDLLYFKNPAYFIDHA